MELDPDSDGLKRAREAGYQTYSNGIKALAENPDLAEIVFDATSAKAHVRHAKILKDLGKMVIDLIPPPKDLSRVLQLILEKILNQKCKHDYVWRPSDYSYHLGNQPS